MPAISPERSALVLLVGILVVIAAVGGTFLLYQHQRTGEAWVTHTLGVEGRLSSIESLELAAESSQRDYLLSGDAATLANFNLFRSQWRTDVSALRREVSDNPAQVAATDILGNLLDQRLGELATGIGRRTYALSADLPDLAPAAASTAAVARHIDLMKAREEELLRVRTEAAGRWRVAVAASLGLSAALIIIFGLLSLRNARRRMLEAMEAREALATLNASLVAEGEEKEKAQAQLRQVQKMETIGQLSGGIAHDFNNMLAIVIGSLDMARRRMGDEGDPRVMKAIDNAGEGAQRAAQLTARLLAFARRQPLSPEPTDINRLVGGMSDMLRRTIGEHIRVESVLAGGLWRTRIDASQLENAIVNLCVNARDAMPDGGRLTLETSNAHLDDAYALAHADVTAGQYALVSVTDTGHGMPAAVIERAFDPFFTTKDVGKGTGLGLSQVFGFVKQSGGHIAIYSEEGAGTTVHLYLPRHYGVEPETDRAVYAPSAPPRARGKEVVMVVEDEDRVRQMSADSLRDLGYAVVSAADGEQALAIMADHPHIDLLFTDVMMPGINGRVLADRACADRPTLKVLYTTGYTRNAIVHNGILDPGVAMLAKPFTFDQLAGKVRQVLDAG